MNLGELFSEYAVPTNEDVLDVNFRSIVSDLNAIMGGTLGPRAWSDISTTWNRPSGTRGAYIRRFSTKEPKSNKHEYNVKRHRILKLARILVANGMGHKEAKVAARHLINGN